MTGLGGPPRGRYHLVLSVEVWEALVAEASQRRMRVSHVVQERLAASLAITGGGGVSAEIPSGRPVVEKGKRHHCRLSLDSLIWDHLARDAAKRRVSVTEMVRQRLREAVWGEVSGIRWSDREESARGKAGHNAPDEGEGEPRSITMYEL